jgi:hypothetical protein
MAARTAPEGHFSATGKHSADEALAAGTTGGFATGFTSQADVRDGQGTGHVPFDILPELHIAAWHSMRLFDPDRDLPEIFEAAKLEARPANLSSQAYPFSGETGSAPGMGYDDVETAGMGQLGVTPPLPLFRAAKARPDQVLIPREADCYALWDRYKMPGHIRRHSQRVADLAVGIARLDAERGSPVNPDAVYAAGLLHDLAKSYCIVYGGNHAEVGAAWVMRETRNGPVAQGVLFHVHWPWDETVTDENFLVLALLYADKRVTHDGYVSLEARYTDLFRRYGINEVARARLREAREQGQRVEAGLSRRLGVKLHEYTAYRGRLVR